MNILEKIGNKYGWFASKRSNLFDEMDSLDGTWIECPLGHIYYDRENTVLAFDSSGNYTKRICDGTMDEKEVVRLALLLGLRISAHQRIKDAHDETY